MTRRFFVSMLVCLFFGTASLVVAPCIAGDHEPSAVKLENLLKAQLEGFEGGEVIVSRVTVPPHTALPRHWHPGEEFAYILEGSCYLWQEGKEDTLCRAGETLMVPLKQVHTAFTRDEGATILVFRVHEAGQPERVPAE
jgi:quercetin dioxygenase-like cupin family protein